MKSPPHPPQVQAAAATLASMASSLLTGLADGKYDSEVAFGEKILTEIGVVFPPAAAVERAIEVFLWVNKMTAPRVPIVPDGRGGFVPVTNSSYDPLTGEFL